MDRCEHAFHVKSALWFAEAGLPSNQSKPLPRGPVRGPESWLYVIWLIASLRNHHFGWCAHLFSFGEDCFKYNVQVSGVVINNKHLKHLFRRCFKCFFVCLNIHKEEVSLAECCSDNQQANSSRFLEITIAQNLWVLMSGNKLAAWQHSGDC